jgi:mannose-6-phosphate isomerase-like protein (cupin superfamily)
MKVSATTIESVERAHGERGEMWHEFLRVPDLSVGLYVIPAGGEDPQNPHNEDEVYLVLSGRGMLTAGDENFEAGPGSILYVAKHVPHRFHDVTEELRVLVFFAPAHTS